MTVKREIKRMVISFQVPCVREYLLENGLVYTFRWRRRSFFKKGKGDVESTWANTGRGTKRIANVDIHEIGEFDSDEPTKKHVYLENSGFSEWFDWYNKIEDMRPPFGFTKGWLYEVHLTEESKENV